MADMPEDQPYTLRPVGHVESELKERRGAPRQGREGAPEAWVVIDAPYADAMDGLIVGDDAVLITWLHQGDRSTLKVYPRGNRQLPLTGIFATRAPDRPNPLGLHRVTILEIDGLRLRVSPLEAIHGTPVVDLKPILPDSLDA